MEEEGIGLVLARATELRLKISNCVHRGAAAAAAAAITRAPPNGLEPLPTHHEHGHGDGNADDDEDEAAERLVNICDALESLETQLSSLQVLQQQQQYEREIALIEIESSRKMLIDKLKEYKGKELEVIHEASTFASETVEHSNDLLLPPYPSRPPYSMCLDKEYLSQIPSVNKSVRNGLITLDPLIEAKMSPGEKEQNHVPVEDGAKNSRKKRFGYFVTAAAKTMLTAVGVVSILSLSGYGPNWVKLGIRFNVKGQFQRPNNEYDRPVTENEDGRPVVHCPPGRVLVLENGEARCLVKERVEIPFSAAAATPDINYGCG